MAHVRINPAARTGRISRFIYGHFIEHLGACIYGGLWVGRSGAIPNTDGLRNDVVEALRRMRPPVIRWPGGCFADQYIWRDGVGPPERRPRRPNVVWGGLESNEFGTHEFVRLCRAVGAEPYICGNVGTGEPRELMQWAEYCNQPDGTALSSERAADGSPEPFRVRFWGIGNESWGCGGNYSPEDYGSAYRRFATFVHGYGRTTPFLIACGPSGNDAEWTRRLLRKVRGDFRSGPPMDALAAHYYCGSAGRDTEYSTGQFYELLRRAGQMEALVVAQRGVMDEFDPERKTKLIVDEWGAWHPALPDGRPRLWQQNTVRDGLAAALTLDIFNRHAGTVYMANIAQMVNVLQAVVLTEGDRMVVTPTGRVYELYADHQDADGVGLEVEQEDIRFETEEGARAITCLAGSASLKGDALTLTLTNAHASEAIQAALTLEGGASAREGRAEVLAGDDLRAHNTFDAPDAVAVRAMNWSASGRELQISLPPASVTKVALRLS